MQTGIYVARLNEKIPASTTTWDEQRDTWMQQAGQTYQDEVFRAFMAGLRQNAQVDIARPDLLN